MNFVLWFLAFPLMLCTSPLSIIPLIISFSNLLYDCNDIAQGPISAITNIDSFQCNVNVTLPLYGNVTVKNISCNEVKTCKHHLCVTNVAFNHKNPIQCARFAKFPRDNRLPSYNFYFELMIISMVSFCFFCCVLLYTIFKEQNLNHL